MRKASSTSKLSASLPSTGSWPSLSTSHEALGGKHFNQRRVHFKELETDDGDDGAALPVYNDYDAMKKRRGFLSRRGNQITWFLWILIRAAVFVSGCIFIIHVASCGMFFCYRIAITNFIPEQFFSSIEYVPVTRSPLSNIHSRFSSPYYHTTLPDLDGGAAAWLAQWRARSASVDGGRAADLRPMPKIVHQTYRDVESIPRDLLRSMESWKKRNRGWEFRFYSDQDVIEFVQREFPEYLDAYNSLGKVVERTDFFRYMVLLKHGGVYADLDTECTRPLDSIIRPEDDVIVGLESMSPSSEYAFKHHFVRSIQMLQWVIISKPDHPILKSVCDHVARHATTVFSNNTNIDTLMRTGPGPWTDAVLRFIDERKEKNSNGTLGVDDLEYMQHRVRVLPRAVFGLNKNHSDDARLLKDKRVAVVHHFSGSWKSMWGWSKTPAFIKFFTGLAGYLTTSPSVAAAARQPISSVNSTVYARGGAPSPLHGTPAPASNMKDDERDINTVLLHDVAHNGYVVSADAVTPFDIFVDRPGRDMVDIGDGRRRHTDASSVISTCGSFEAGMEAGQACPKGLSLLSIFIAAMDDFARARSPGDARGEGTRSSGSTVRDGALRASVADGNGMARVDGVEVGVDGFGDDDAVSAASGDGRVGVGAVDDGLGRGEEGDIEGLFVDIGAGLGYYSLGVAAHGNKVLAFEPAGRQHVLFRQSIDFNRLRDYVEVRDVVLGRSVESACNGSSDMLADEGGGQNRVGARPANATDAVGGVSCARRDLDDIQLRDGSVLGSLASASGGDVGVDARIKGALRPRVGRGLVNSDGDGDTKDTGKELGALRTNAATTALGAADSPAGLSVSRSSDDVTTRRHRIVAMRIGSFEQLLAILDGANSIFTSNNVDVVEPMTEEADAIGGAGDIRGESVRSTTVQSQGPPLYVSIELIPSLLRDDNIDTKTLLWRMYDLHYTEIAHKGHVCSARWKSIRFRQAINNYKFTPVRYNKAKARFSKSTKSGSDADDHGDGSDGDPWCKLDPDAFYLIDRWGHSTRPEVILFRYTGGRDKTNWR